MKGKGVLKIKLENCIINTKEDVKRILRNIKDYNYALSEGTGIPYEAIEEDIVYWAGDWRTCITPKQNGEYAYYSRNNCDGSIQKDTMDLDRVVDELYRNRNSLNYYVNEAMKVRENKSF